jgi:hypothetical protein
VRLEQVWINDAPYADFDADALTVKLPNTSERVNVKVRLVPVPAPKLSTDGASSQAAEGVVAATPSPAAAS